MKNESFFEKHFLENYISILYLVATLEWVEKLSLNFSYLTSHEIKLFSLFSFAWDKGSVWYMCLKTENYYLKTFVEICVGEKEYGNTCNVV